MMTHTLPLIDENATAELANSIARVLVCGDVLRLQGELGAGKSTFTRYLLKALGSTATHMPSPTFTIAQTYSDTRLPVAHIDLYRLGDPSEIETLGLEEYLQHGISVVEWPQNGGHYYSPQQEDADAPTEVDKGGFLTINITINDDDTRTATLEADQTWAKRLAMMFPELRRAQSDQARMDWLNNNGYSVQQPPSCVAADASFRSYWRFEHEGTSKILMDAPPPLENVTPFANMAEYLLNNGFTLAQVESIDHQQSYLVESDLGDGTLFDKIIAAEDCNQWYSCAVDILTQLYQTHQQNPNPQLTAYTAADLWAEVARFVDWCLPFQQGSAVEPTTREQWHDTFQPLFDELMTFPQTTMIWDYHAANLMPQTATPEGTHSLALLDFQDARHGPLPYDLSMLLEDARLDMAPQLKQELLQKFSDAVGIDAEKFERGFVIASLIRTLKIIGCFERLDRRDNKPKYRDFLPRCWNYVAEHLKHPVTEPVRPLLEPLLASAQSKAA